MGQANWVLLVQRVFDPRSMVARRVLVQKVFGPKIQILVTWFSGNEADASYRCLHENNFDRDSCTKYFLNYKNCRKFWGNFALDRRRNGIKPALPAKEERDKILENLSLK
ncbi:coiled-coil-helix-coiled-coil-helix domain-containing protein 7-like isoform X1 [Anneissia japonica]|uniref:coiled-coil-helix-coiled-coil-helix domain-containing protein 7-like isoform X1 n=1 Tax=Anneissia japonica TaxID=1529436 RepID=UPI001425523D|nr:coiled-coil-helix-coiled-coil-helix domain-containing protein 7-like isoform X1 [Anneissia japonica]